MTPERLAEIRAIVADSRESPRGMRDRVDYAAADLLNWADALASERESFAQSASACHLDAINTRVALAKAIAERDEARAWFDRANGMLNRAVRTLTCVYCGQEYPEGTPASGAGVEALTSHIATCEKHPMRAVCAERDALRRGIAAALEEVRDCHGEDCGGGAAFVILRALLRA